MESAEGGRYGRAWRRRTSSSPGEDVVAGAIGKRAGPAADGGGLEVAEPVGEQRTVELRRQAEDAERSQTGQGG